MRRGVVGNHVPHSLALDSSSRMVNGKIVACLLKKISLKY
jgi:hypothetical protein